VSGLLFVRGGVIGMFREERLAAAGGRRAPSAAFIEIVWWLQQRQGWLRMAASVCYIRQSWERRVLDSQLSTDHFLCAAVRLDT
jgi:hypothetical protein